MSTDKRDPDVAYEIYLLACACAACGAAPPITDLSSDTERLAAQALGVRDGLALHGNVLGAKVSTRAQFAAELVALVGQPS